MIFAGHQNFSSLCAKFFSAAPAYGLGDTQIWSDLKRMADAASPLIRLTESPDPARASSRLHTVYSVTENGERVMTGKGDFVEQNSVDMWLGGVHLRPDNLWRWDEQGRTLLAVN